MIKDDQNQLTKSLSIETLGLVDGTVSKHIIDEALSQAIKDCSSRPGVKKARVVTIKVEIKPACVDSGHMDGFDVNVQTQTAIPPVSTKPEFLRVDYSNNSIEARFTSGDRNTIDMFDESDQKGSKND